MKRRPYNKAERIGVLGDLHLATDLPYSIPDDNLRTKRLFAFLEKAFKSFIEHKVSLILLAGDICNKTFLSGRDLTLLINFIDLLRNTKLPAVMIFGNHDSDYNDCILEFLSNNKKLVPNLYFSISDKQIYEIGTNRIVAINYLKKDNDFLRIAKEEMLPSDKNRRNILLGHIGIKGTLHGTTKSIVGIKGEDIEKLSSGYDLMVFGHHHKFQAVASNGFYSGAIQQTRADEKDSIPGGLIVDLPDFKVKRIINKESPRFKLITDYKIIPEEIRGNIIRVNLDLENKSRFENEDFLKKIISCSPYFLIKPKLTMSKIEGVSDFGKISNKNKTKKQFLEEIVNKAKAPLSHKKYVLDLYNKNKE